MEPFPGRGETAASIGVRGLPLNGTEGEENLGNGG